MGWVRAQVSMEYLAVMGISLLMILPLLLLFSEQSVHFQQQINTAHLERSSFELLSASEKVFLLGPPSSLTLRVTFPDSIQSVSVEPTGFVFNLSGGSSSGTIFALDSHLPLNLSGSLGTFQGLHVINVTATSSGVVVGELT